MMHERLYFCWQYFSCGGESGDGDDDGDNDDDGGVENERWKRWWWKKMEKNEEKWEGEIKKILRRKRVE